MCIFSSVVTHTRPSTLLLLPLNPRPLPSIPSRCLARHLKSFGKMHTPGGSMVHFTDQINQTQHHLLRMQTEQNTNTITCSKWKQKAAASRSRDICPAGNARKPGRQYTHPQTRIKVAIFAYFHSETYATGNTRKTKKKKRKKIYAYLPPHVPLPPMRRAGSLWALR